MPLLFNFNRMKIKGKKNKQTFKSIDDIQREYRLYFNRLLELSISMFEWKNLPDTVDPRFLELALFWNGSAVFFKDNDLGYLCLECVLGGRYDVYRIPTDRRAVAINGYNNELTPNDSVLIFNNMIHENSFNEVYMYAQNLYDIDNTIRVNLNAQKTPILVTCDETQKLTMQNLYQQYQGNIPVIFGDKQIKPNSIQVLKTDAPFLADRLIAMKMQIWNEALTYLGISNVNIQKRERLLNDEVHRNMGATIASRYSRLESRRQACEQINRMFGLDISCDYREDFQVIDNLVDDTYNGEDEEGD